MITVKSIVTRRRGTWRYQDAFAVATYAPHRTKDGRWVWRSLGSRGKWSEPQLRRLQIRALLGVGDEGGLHHRPISPDDLRLFALA